MRILIKEIHQLSSKINLVKWRKAAIRNGKTLLSMLDKLGLTLDTVNDWGH
jgi:hypothetical protein